MKASGFVLPTQFVIYAFLTTLQSPESSGCSILKVLSSCSLDYTGDHRNMRAFFPCASTIASIPTKMDEAVYYGIRRARWIAEAARPEISPEFSNRVVSCFICWSRLRSIYYFLSSLPCGSGIAYDLLGTTRWIHSSISSADVFHRPLLLF